MRLNAEPSTRAALPSHVYRTLTDATAAVEYLITRLASPGNPKQGPYVLGVARREGGELLGHVGFSPLDSHVEVSYAIAEAARGQGLGAEALGHACDWVSRSFAIEELLAITASDNQASRRTLARAGFQHASDETMRFQGAEQLVSRYLWRATIAP